MSLDQLHMEIANVCKSDLGVALSLDLLSKLFNDEIEKLNSSVFSTGIPFPVQGLEVSVHLPPGATRLAIDQVRNCIKVNAQLIVNIHISGDNTKTFGKTEIRYTDAEALLVESVNPLGRVILAMRSSGGYSYKLDPNRPVEFLDRLVEAGFVDSDGNPDVQGFLGIENSVFMFNQDSFIKALLSMIPFPRLRDSMKVMRLGSPLMFDFTHSHLVVHSPNVQFDFGDCSRSGRAADELRTGDNSLILGHGSDHEEKLHGLSGDDAKSLTSDFRRALLFYYPERVLFNYTSGTLKPAVTFSDSDVEMAIFWYYSITASLKQVKVTFRPVSLTEAALVIDSPSEIVAVAGAGIEIGCIKYEVFDVKGLGNIDPLRTQVIGGIDKKKKKLYLKAMLDPVTSQDIAWSTGFGFPFDQVADFIIDRIIDNEFNEIKGQSIDIFSMDLADLSNIHTFKNMDIFDLESDATGQKSVLYSLRVGEMGLSG